MDLVDANEGPSESDHPLNTNPERPALNGAGGGPGTSGHNHSQSSSAISIVQVTLPQAQVSAHRKHTHRRCRNLLTTSGFAYRLF